MCNPILLKLRPLDSQPSRENATPSSGTPPLACYKEVPRVWYLKVTLKHSLVTCVYHPSASCSANSKKKSEQEHKVLSRSRNITSSNKRLWECVRCCINVYPDTLNNIPSWLSTSKNQPFFINKRGFTERYFSYKVHASLIDWWLRCVTAPVSVDSNV